MFGCLSGAIFGWFLCGVVGLAGGAVALGLGVNCLLVDSWYVLAVYSCFVWGLYSVLFGSWLIVWPLLVVTVCGMVLVRVTLHGLVMWLLCGFILVLCLRYFSAGDVEFCWFSGVMAVALGLGWVV